MISGVVTGNLEATVRLQIRGPAGQEQEIDAVIDTGFNGFLTLSLALVRQLSLPHLGQSRVLLANGQEELWTCTGSPSYGMASSGHWRWMRPTRTPW
jgi:predicted aspartyl protease